MTEVFQSEYGDNSWLVAEMREHYLADPAGVPQRWANYFADTEPNPQPVADDDDPVSRGRIAAEPATTSDTPEPEVADDFEYTF